MNFEAFFVLIIILTYLASSCARHHLLGMLEHPADAVDGLLTDHHCRQQVYSLLLQSTAGAYWQQHQTVICLLVKTYLVHQELIVNTGTKHII